MADKEHRYTVTVEWTGNLGAGTAGYRAYERQHEITVPADPKPTIPGSSDPAFRGDRGRWNPEELLVASLSACHQLWYLHLCADAGVVVTGYVDRAEGMLEESENGSGRFTRVLLQPIVIVAPGSDAGRARALHEQAHALCFIARSVNFPVECEPDIRVAADGT
ncbi:MAG TPA: OsmC family protein [Gemmatimonadaceae bacterium]|nr:OsmC family protein [Gemmatimonadaceae bacterium]